MVRWRSETWACQKTTKNETGGGEKPGGKQRLWWENTKKNTLKTVEPPKKGGGLQTLGQLQCLFGKVRYTLSPAGKPTSAAEERSIGIQGRGVIAGLF